MIRGLHVICSYHSYEDAPCPIHSLDIIGVRSLSLRLASNNNHSDDFKKQLRSDIAKIVRSYEKSKNNVAQGIRGPAGGVRLMVLPVRVTSTWAALPGKRPIRDSAKTK